MILTPEEGRRLHVLTLLEGKPLDRKNEVIGAQNCSRYS